jgi:aromatic amino acid transport protein AroP
VANLWQHGGFFPNGVSGLVMAMAVIMFSFGGLELIGITAAEADNPSQTIPKATNQAIYRILIFYIGALGILLSLYPWEKVVTSGSPFVLIFHALNSNLVAHALNVVVLTAALSVYNSGVYSNTRMLYGLAKQGNAPQSLLKVNARGVPLTALACRRWPPASAWWSTTSCRQGVRLPDGAGGVGADHQLGLISWIHLRFRAHKKAEGKARSSRAWATRSPTTCAWPSWRRSWW